MITERKKEDKTMMTMNFDTYTMIADLLFEEDLTVEEIAEQCGVSVEAVQYVDRCENDTF